MHLICYSIQTKYITIQSASIRHVPLDFKMVHLFQYMVYLNSCLQWHFYPTTKHVSVTRLLHDRKAVAFIYTTGGRHVLYHLSTDTQLGLESKLTLDMFGIRA